LPASEAKLGRGNSPRAIPRGEKVKDALTWENGGTGRGGGGGGGGAGAVGESSLDLSDPGPEFYDLAAHEN